MKDGNLMMTNYGCNGCSCLERYKNLHYCKAMLIHIDEVGPDTFFDIHGVALTYAVIEENIMSNPDWCPKKIS